MNKKEINFEASTLKEVLQKLEKEFPSFKGKLLDSNGELRKFLALYINGEDIKKQKSLDTKVKSGDEVAIIPAVAGGDMEKLEILKMIKDSVITPEEGVRLIEAINKSEEHAEQKISSGAQQPRWLKIEFRMTKSGKLRNLTPIKIPFSVIKILSRFIPKDSLIPGHAFNFDKIVNSLASGEPLDLMVEKDGMMVRISAE